MCARGRLDREHTIRPRGQQGSMTYKFHLRRRTGVFSKRLLLALVLSIAWILGPTPAVAAGYQYPYRDPYLATATTAILSDDGATPRVDSTIIHVPGLPGRNHLPTLEGRGDVSLALYRQSRAAPLLFILAGLGSSPYFGVAPYLASVFYREGFHVVILPSPMSWNFALSASRSGAPGYPPEDARDLYEVMQKTLTTVTTRYAVKTTSINFLGVSLGALQGAYLSVVDADAGKIGVDKFLLINPPVDLAYAVKTIDEWSGLRKKFGREKSQEIVSKALAIVNSFAEERQDKPAVFERLAKKLRGFNTEEFQYLIAENLQSQLPELIYVSQIIHDQKLTGAKIDQRKRLEEAREFTFTKYNQMIAMPWWQKQLGDPEADLDAFMQRGSLAPVVDRLLDNPKVHILHNADDFLAERKSLEALKNTLGERVTLYPYGGHLGNLWYPENKEFAVKYFRPQAYARIRN
jgi:predicted alpha/beta-fold hydrolase